MEIVDWHLQQPGGSRSFLALQEVESWSIGCEASSDFELVHQPNCKAALLIPVEYGSLVRESGCESDRIAFAVVDINLIVSAYLPDKGKSLEEYVSCAEDLIRLVLRMRKKFPKIEVVIVASDTNME